MASFWDTLRAWFSPPEERALSPNAAWGADLDWNTSGSSSGMKVDLETSLTSIAVHAAIRLLVNDIGTLPSGAFRSTASGKTELPAPLWMLAPSPINPNATWQDHIKQVVFGILTDGNSFTYCLPNVLNPQEIRVLDPGDVEIQTTGGEVNYKVDGADRLLTPLEVLHIPWLVRPGKTRGINPIEAAEEGLGIALATDRFVGRFFGEGATLSGVIEFPPGVTVEKETVAQMKEDFRRKHAGVRKSHAVGALMGATYKPIVANNRDSQLLELRDQVVEDVARMFGIPPHMLGSQKPGAVSYASVEQRSLDYTQHAVLPIVARIERGYSRLLGAQDAYIKFNLNGLMRGDAAARATFYTAMLQNKVMPVEEVRALEDLTPRTDATGFLQTPNNNNADPRYEAVGALIRAGFDPTEALNAVGLPPIKHLGNLPVTVQADREPTQQEPAA